MITISKIKLSNFLSHEDTEISFNDSEKMLIDGKSGSGKSSLIEAVLWCLYGKGRVDNRNIIRRGAKNASVTLDLLDDDTYYQITRKTSDKGKTGLEIAILKGDSDKELVGVEGLKEKQEWIEKTLLRSSYILFINSIIYLQDNVDIFVKQTASKRKELLLEIANVGDYEMYYNRAKEELNLSTEERARMEAVCGEKERIIESNLPISLEIESLEKEDTTTTLLLDTAKKKLEDITLKIQQREAVSIELKMNESLLSGVLSQIENTKKDIDAKKEKIEAFKNIDRTVIDEKISELADLRSRLVDEEKAEQEYFAKSQQRTYLMSQKPTEYDYEGEIASLNKQIIAIMTDQSKKCTEKHTHCPQLEAMSRTQIKYIEDQIKEKGIKMEAQKEALEAYTARLEALGPHLTYSNAANELRTKIRDLEKYEKEKMSFDAAEAQIEDTKKEVESLLLRCDELTVSSTDIMGKINKLREIMSGLGDGYSEEEMKIKSDISSLQSSLMQIAQRLTLAKHAKGVVDSATVELNIIRSKIISITERVNSLLAIKEAFGPKGIKTLVIDYIIPRLEERVNDILGQLSDFKVRLDTQRQSADGETMIEGLFINIYNDIGEEFDYDAYSGGQKLKITIAISEALASLQKCSFRIFDETFIGLDEESTEGFVAVLDQLKSNFKQVFCISHMRQIKDVFDDSIEIVRENGISRII